jgi:glycosyltransferase involved in cell wall biosynthesis
VTGGFSRRRARYVGGILRQGPVEAGYAFFRARRRNRNIADEAALDPLDRAVAAGELDATVEDLAANADTIIAWEAASAHDIRSVLWLVPWFHNPHGGGVATVLRFADHFARVHGVHNHFCVFDRHDDGDVRDIAAKLASAYPSLVGATVLPAGAVMPHCDAALATAWPSAYPLLGLRTARAKFFFVQDFEPAFHPAGAGSAALEQAARLGFPGIANTPGVAEVYRSYGSPAIAFTPAVDPARLHPPASPRPAAPVRIVFYGRPSTPRNAFALGLAALRLVKRSRGDAVEIVAVGEDWHPGQFGVADVLENRGAIADLDALAELYRSCHVGLVLQVTPHPSYQPLELMASGVACVALENPYARWLLRHDVNALLAAPVPSAVAAQLELAVDDALLRERLARAGADTVATTTWEAEIERVWAAMTRRGERFS